MPSAKAAVKAVEQKGSILTNSNALSFNYESLAEAFPDVEPGLKPLGNLGLFMIRRPKSLSRGGIIIVDDGRATEYYNTQVAKCIAVGPLAFKTVRNVDREEVIFDWPEGPWFKPGDFVRVPKYGGDRFTVEATVSEWETMIGGSKVEKKVEDAIVFAIFKVREIQGVITGNPLTIKAFLD